MTTGHRRPHKLAFCAVCLPSDLQLPSLGWRVAGGHRGLCPVATLADCAVPRVPSSGSCLFVYVYLCMPPPPPATFSVLV